jgi:PhnB protein
MAVKPIPEGYPRVTPVLNVNGAAQLIEFMKKAFGFEERMRMPAPGGAIGHAELQLGESMVMLSDALREPAMPGSIFLYVEDADARYRAALAAGATSIQEPTDMFWGDRFARVRDPAGNLWGIATHKEDLSQEEMGRRMEEASRQAQS